MLLCFLFSFPTDSLGFYFGLWHDPYPFFGHAHVFVEAEAHINSLQVFRESFGCSSGVSPFFFSSFPSGFAARRPVLEAFFLFAECEVAEFLLFLSTFDFRLRRHPCCLGVQLLSIFFRTWGGRLLGGDL